MDILIQFQTPLIGNNIFFLKYELNLVRVLSYKQLGNNLFQRGDL